MRAARRLAPLLALLAVALAGATYPASAPATEAPSSETPSWHVEPLYPPGLEDPATQAPVGLGRIGDIEFWAPNRGVLVTAGNGSTIPAGVWAYDGVRWHELSTVCGASDGRIAWAGPDDFWTVSDGRPGQAANPSDGTPAPIADRTLCHFSGDPVQVVGSYASAAFQANSYQEMHAAACLSETDCWFAGDPLPEPQAGAFHLHWDGHSLSAVPNPQGHPVEDMTRLGRYLYESVRLLPGDRLTEPEPFPPLVLRRISPVGYQPTFVPLSTRLPGYSPGELPAALDYLRLGADDEALWAVAGPSLEPPEGSTPAEVTVLRYEGGAWSQILGPGSDPPAGNPLGEDIVHSVAPEPGAKDAWLALDSVTGARSPSPLASAALARIAADGSVSEAQTLPGAGEGIGPKGVAEKIVCPALADCWMVTSQGWLFHYSNGSTEQPDPQSPFTSLIGFRPLDEGLPQVEPDAPPADTSGAIEAFQPPPFVPIVEKSEAPLAPARVKVALLSHVKTNLVHRYTLEVRFHLAVRARVRLVAKRSRATVGSTRLSTLAAGNRHLLLPLDPRRWPTKLDLQTHALAPLPTVPAGKAEGTGAGSGVVVSEARFDPATRRVWMGQKW